MPLPSNSKPASTWPALHLNISKSLTMTMTPARTRNSSSSSATLPDLMDGLRLRLLMALWAGVLVLVLSALYDLPTNSSSSRASGEEPSTTSMHLPHNNLRGTATSTTLVSGSKSSNISSEQSRISFVSWRPILEEEARAIDMLSQPFQHIFSSSNAAKES